MPDLTCPKQNPGFLPQMCSRLSLSWVVSGDSAPQLLQPRVPGLALMPFFLAFVQIHQESLSSPQSISLHPTTAPWPRPPAALTWVVQRAFYVAPASSAASASFPFYCQPGPSQA